MNRYRLTQARLPEFEGLQDLWIENGNITAIVPSTPTPQHPNTPIPQHPNTPTPPIKLDLAGDYLSLGGLDLQINGALGLAFPDVTSADHDKLREIQKFLWISGVDAYCPTIVTAPLSKIQTALASFAELSPEPDQAQVAGIHLEGPFLNPIKRGAHPEEHIQALTIENLKLVLGDYASIVKIITLAPEMEIGTGAIEYLQNLGITISLGHSLATADQANQAFEQGASMVTHACNAMPSLHHRDPGLLGSAIVNSNVTCGFIADGKHVSPLMLDILMRASEYDRGLFLVSDALSPLGLPDGQYPWDERTIEVTQGTARLPDGTLSGTTLGLLVGVQNLMNWKCCDLEHAIAMATITPRRAIQWDSTFTQNKHSLLRWTHHQPGQWNRLAL